MEKGCISCGMPLIDNDEIGGKDELGYFCLHCVDNKSKIKSCNEIFKGGVEFFLKFDSDRELAERVTRKNMNNQIFWKNKNEKILEGDEATDEEFQIILNKIFGK